MQIIPMRETHSFIVPASVTLALHTVNGRRTYTWQMYAFSNHYVNQVVCYSHQ